MKTGFFLAMLLIAGLASPSRGAEAALDDKVRGPMFAAAQSALERANSVRASVLAPTSYAQGAEDYRQAEAVFGEGGKLDRIRELLDGAAAAFDAAAKASEVASKTLETAYQARLDAEAAGAPEFAGSQWKAAELQFFEAVSRLEAGKTRRVDRYAQAAEDGYRAAELGAIQTSLLDEIEAWIERADDAGAKRKAPKSFTFANDLLDRAKADLAENRYDTDRPRTLAGQSLHYAKHALYISKLYDGIDDGETTLEGVLMDWEARIAEVANGLDLAVFFDDGPEQAITEVTTAIAQLQQQTQDLRANLTDRDDHVEVLEQEIDRLSAELGGQAAQRERLDRELARQQRRAARIKKRRGAVCQGGGAGAARAGSPRAAHDRAQLCER